MQKTLRFLLLFSLSLLPLALCASDFLRMPLRFVAADSVSVWSTGGERFERAARAADRNAEPLPLRLTKVDWKARRATLRAWTEAARSFDRLGGVTDNVPATVKRFVESVQLFRMTGQAAFADHYERALYNTFLRTARDTTLFESSIDRMLAAMALRAVPSLVYATDGEQNLFVNLYLNNTARVRLGDAVFTFDQVASMPLDGRVRMRITRLDAPRTFRLCLRLPDWTSLRTSAYTPYIYSAPERPAVTIFVNGHEVETYEPDARGYLVIEREWRTMDEVYVDFGLTPCYLRRADEPGLLRGRDVVQRGPQVFRVTEATAGCYFSLTSPIQTENDLDAHENVQVRGRMYRDAAAPQDAAAPEEAFHARAF